MIIIILIIVIMTQSSNSPTRGVESSAPLLASNKLLPLPRLLRGLIRRKCPSGVLRALGLLLEVLLLPGGLDIKLLGLTRQALRVAESRP